MGDGNGVAGKPPHTPVHILMKVNADLKSFELLNRVWISLYAFEPKV
jgi:hypothetical protein